MSQNAIRAFVYAAMGVMVLGLAACPRTGGDSTGPGKGSGTGTGAATPDAGPTELPPRRAGQPLLPPEGIACAANGCVYHAGAAGYFTCTNGSAGSCFHFGASCGPTDGCMFDAADGRYKECSNIVEGQCSTWGGACTPANSCMFKAADGLHHSCDAVSDGKCTSWGGLCDPG